VLFLEVQLLPVFDLSGDVLVWGYGNLQLYTRKLHVLSLANWTVSCPFSSTSVEALSLALISG
jgi:hypothetical protein